VSLDVTAPNWTPEREISADRAGELIRGGFAGLAQASVQPFAQGWDNTAFMVRAGSDLVFRFPRRAIALDGVRREAAWLPALAPLLPLPIPVPAFQGEWSDAPDAQPWPFWGAALLGGTEFAVAGLEPGERVAIAAGLGIFLRALHDLPPPELAAAARVPLAVDPLGRGDPARRHALTSACLDRLRETDVDAPLDGAAALVDRAAQLPPSPGPVVICHGDLHVRHVLVDSGAGQTPAITGIIDWGDLCLADPGVDLSISFAAFSGESRQAFFAAYGPITADRELRARALAVSLSGLLTEYALAHTGEEAAISALLPEASAGLARALEGAV
jgi:aminoglycoside phosphotransferase (APT) family kinase protein